MTLTFAFEWAQTESQLGWGNLHSWPGCAAAKTRMPVWAFVSEPATRKSSVFRYFRRRGLDLLCPIWTLPGKQGTIHPEQLETRSDPKTPMDRTTSGEIRTGESATGMFEQLDARLHSLREMQGKKGHAWSGA